MSDKIYKSYKFRLLPKEGQIPMIEKHFGCSRFVYNYFLDLKIKEYKDSQKSLSRFDCQKLLTKLKSQNDFNWLNEVNSQSLQSSLKNLDTSYQTFFKKRSKFPRFKSKKSKNSFHVPQFVDVIDNELRIPKFVKTNKLQFIKHRPIKGKICSATISKNPSGKYYVSILTEQFNEEDQSKTGSSIGIDLGIKDFIITSDGNKFPNYRFKKQYQSKLSKLQKHFARKQKGSNRKEKLRIKIAKLHEKITNSREDMQHKLSSSLLNKYDVICLETLAVKNMMNNHRLAEAIGDTAWYSFTNKLQYKAQWRGKRIVQIEQFYPSSKTCNKCGYINQGLKLKDRMWICPNCGQTHDRDINAARNILNRGLTILKQSSSGTDDYRHGAEIRPITEFSMNGISNEVSKNKEHKVPEAIRSSV